MSNDKATTGGNSEVAATTTKQIIEKNIKGVPTPAAASAPPPWTAEFDLPSIQAPEPKHD